MKHHAKSPAVEGGPVTLVDDKGNEVKGTVRQLNPSGEMIVVIPDREHPVWAHNHPRKASSKEELKAAAPAKAKGSKAPEAKSPQVPLADESPAPTKEADAAAQDGEGGEDDGKSHFE